MIDENRLRQMTRIAMLEKQYGDEMKPVLKYGRKDYVGVCTFASFLVGTIVFLAVYILLVLAVVNFNTQNMESSTLMKAGITGFIVYLIYIVIHIYVSRRLAQNRYTAGAKKVDELTAEYVNLVDMYTAEGKNAINERRNRNKKRYS